MNRITIATFSGLMFGLVCYSLASSGDYELAWPIAVSIIASRTLMGFAIGISCLRLHHWSIRGLVMGFLFSLPMSFAGMLSENPEFSKWAMFFSTAGIGMIYGLLIEIITSVLFKKKIKVSSKS